MFKPAAFDRFTGTNFYSNTEVFVFEDAIYHPGIGHNDGKMGIFTREGYLIPQAAFRCAMPPQTKGHPTWVNPSLAKTYPTVDSAIFVGHLHDQYGHLITEFLSRMTSLSKIRKDEKLLIRCVRGFSDLFEIFRWVGDVFSHLDIKKEDLFCPTTPVRIKKLIVQTPAFVEQSHCYSELARYCQAIGDRAVSRVAKPPAKNEIVYLSRSRLICGTVKIDNERELEAALKNRGVRVVNPEILSFAEQISLFRNGNVVTGGVGSAFHTSIFCPDPIGVAINFKSNVDSNYALMDGASGAAIDYVGSELIGKSENPDENFYETNSITNIDEFADELVELARSKKNRFHVPNMGISALSTPVDISFFRLINHEGHAITVDSRTGELSAWDGPLRQYLLVLRIPVGGEKFRYFLVSEGGNSFLFKDDFLGGPAFDVSADNVAGKDGHFYIKMNNQDAYFRNVPRSLGGECLLTRDTPSVWEEFRLEPFGNFVPEKGSLLHDLCSLLSYNLIKSVNTRIDYYVYKNPDLVSYVNSIARASADSGDVLSP